MYKEYETKHFLKVNVCYLFIWKMLNKICCCFSVLLKVFCVFSVKFLKELRLKFAV